MSRNSLFQHIKQISQCILADVIAHSVKQQFTEKTEKSEIALEAAEHEASIAGISSPATGLHTADYFIDNAKEIASSLIENVSAKQAKKFAKAITFLGPTKFKETVDMIVDSSFPDKAHQKRVKKIKALQTALSKTTHPEYTQISNKKKKQLNPPSL